MPGLGLDIKERVRSKGDLKSEIWSGPGFRTLNIVVADEASIAESDREVAEEAGMVVDRHGK